jgi:integrase
MADGLLPQAPLRALAGHCPWPGRKRHTKTDKLKSVVKHWATEQEAAIARGEFRDPRLGDIKAGEWYRRVAAARATDPATKAKHASLWATHCEPQWARWPMSAITRMEAQEWVNGLQLTRRARHKGRAVTDDDEDVPAIGAETICAAVHVMSQLYDLAMKETPPIVLANPFSSLELPVIRPHEIDFLERGEAEALYAAAGEIGSRWRTLIELGTEVGLRPGELYGLHGHRVDWLRGRIQVIDVMTRSGLRHWPKSKKSHRVVPVPAHIMEAMSALMNGRTRDALVFTAPEGRPGGRRELQGSRLVSGRRGCGHPPLPAADHAPYRGELAGDRRGAAVRRPGAPRAPIRATTVRAYGSGPVTTRAAGLG